MRILQGMAVHGSHIYAADGMDEVLMVNARAEPSPHQPRDSIEASHPTHVLADAGYLYLAAKREPWFLDRDRPALFLYDVGESSDPVADIATIRLADMALDGDRVYLLGETGELQIVDVSERSKPRTALRQALLPATGGESRPVEHLQIAAADGFVVTAAGDDGLLVYDVGDDHTPRLVASSSECGRALDVAVAGGHVYCLGSPDGLHVFRLAAPGR